MSNSSILFRLQQIDSNIDQTRNRLVEIEAILNNTTAIDEAIRLVAAAETALKTVQKGMREIEHQVADQKMKIEQNESALYGGRIRNPKELQDLQNEAFSLKRYLSVLEDRQLEAMLSVEELEQEYERAVANLNAVRGSLEERYAQLRGEKTHLTQQLKRLELERKAAAGSISASDMDFYDQLRQMRNGIAVARIVDQSCSACGSTMTPALAQAARSINQLVRCASCNRILFAG